MEYENATFESLFDKDGYKNPKGLESDFCDPSRSYGVKKITLDTLDCEKILGRFYGSDGIGHFGINTWRFKKEAKRLLGIIEKNPQISNIIKGPYFPIIVWPKPFEGDIGTNLEWLVSIIENSNKFCNKCKGSLSNQVCFVKESRHEQLIKRMKGDSIVGLYFPIALQGFSVDAAREQMATLPEGFFLSGLDVIIALIMYPDILEGGYYGTACLELSALKYSNNHSFAIKNVGGEETFLTHTNFLSRSWSAYSSGLLFLG